MDDNRRKALEAALSQIERRLAKVLSCVWNAPRSYPAISTGSLGLDIALGSVVFLKDDC